MKSFHAIYEGLQAPEALLSVLRQAPILKDAQPSFLKPEAPGTLVTLPLPDRQVRLLVEAIGNGQPRRVRQAIHELRYKNRYPDAYVVLVAPYISEQAAELCRQEDVGYIDFGGNYRLAFDGIFLQSRIAPNLYAEKRQPKSLYAPKAERVLRVLLAEPRHRWRLQALANAARVSLGQVANIKELLADREWLHQDAGGVSLSLPEALLGDWVRHYSLGHHEAKHYYSMKSVPEFEALLAEEAEKLGVRYAFTGFSGAARVAPQVRYQRVMAFVEPGEGFGRLIDALGLKEVTSGANVTLLRPYDEGVFYGAYAIDGMSVAAPVQLYLDLMDTKGRGEEAAEAILNKVILPQWQ